MKIWELEDGKEYVSSWLGGETKYQLIDGDLYYMSPSINYGNYIRSRMEYNWVKELDFTLYTPPTDWSKVEVDTKVLVRDWDDSKWIPRYFAKFEDDRVYVWNEGRTSFTRRDEKDYVYYGQVKLYESFKATKSIVEEMREYIGAGGETMDKKLRQWISQLNGAFL